MYIDNRNKNIINIYILELVIVFSGKNDKKKSRRK